MTNGLSAFFIKDKSVFSNGPESLPKNLPDCPIIWYWIFDNVILAEKLFPKALRSFETYLLGSDNLCEKLVSL